MISITKMTLEDLEQIKKNLKDDFDDFWNENILKSELESNNSIYFVAKEEEIIVGFAGILILPDSVEITNIVTKKTMRKKGIGNLLLETLIENAKILEKDNISLEVNENNINAIKLYEKNEFKKIGIRKKYYNGIDDAIIMTKNL